VILQGADPVGFALVTRLRMPPAAAEGASFFRMSEFFIRRPHRRMGVGRNAATLIFDRFTGDWEIHEYQRNPGAVAFWRRVLAVYCPGSFTERMQNGEVHQRFKSRPSTFR
jgi:predicted acetyltransferase